MPQQDPNSTIVLCIDIDGTLIDSCQVHIHQVHFTGSIKNNDADHWVRLLLCLQQVCAQLNVHFIVQIISAKISGQIDNTVDWVAKYLHTFLKPLNGDAQPIESHCSDYDGIPTQYYAMCHRAANQTFKYLCDNLTVNQELMGIQSIVDDALLPPIHICFQNHPLGWSSKAMVMETISKHLGGIPRSNMIMLDNSCQVATEIANYKTVYQCVSASSLSSGPQTQRVTAFKTLGRVLEEKILARATAINFVRNKSFLNQNSDSSASKSQKKRKFINDSVSNIEANNVINELLVIKYAKY